MWAEALDLPWDPENGTEKNTKHHLPHQGNGTRATTMDSVFLLDFLLDFINLQTFGVPTQKRQPPHMNLYNHLGMGEVRFGRFPSLLDVFFFFFFFFFFFLMILSNISKTDLIASLRRSLFFSRVFEYCRPIGLCG